MIFFMKYFQNFKCRSNWRDFVHAQNRAKLLAPIVLLSGPTVVLLGPTVVLSGPTVVLLGPTVILSGPTVVLLGPTVVLSGPTVVLLGPIGSYRGLNESYCNRSVRSCCEL